MTITDYIARCAITSAILLTSWGALAASEPVFAGDESSGSSPLAGAPPTSSLEEYSDREKRVFCELAGVRLSKAEKAPIAIDGQEHLGLAQVMVRYTTIGGCQVTAQVLIKQREAIKVMDERIDPDGTTSKDVRAARLATIKKWMISGKGVGSVVAGVSQSLLEKSSFSRLRDVPFVNLEVNAVLIGSNVKEFTFPMREALGASSTTPHASRVVYEISQNEF